MSGRSQCVARREGLTSDLRQHTMTAAIASTIRGAYPMRCSFGLLVLGVAFAAGATAFAQGPTYNRGRAATAEEIRAWDSAEVDGKNLPLGSGTALQGAPIFSQKCAVCHGTNGEGRDVHGGGPRLVGNKGTTDGLRAWPFATAIWNFIHKAMPLGQGESLNADEVYALTAFLLHKNDIIKENDVVDAKDLPKIQMPNRYGFVPSPWPNPDVKAFRTRCPGGLCP